MNRWTHCPVFGRVGGVDAADVLFVAPDGLNPADYIARGRGQDTLQLTASGAYDFSGVTVADVERIVGTAGDDVLNFDSLPAGLVSLDSGGGHDVLRVAARTDFVIFMGLQASQLQAQDFIT